MGETSDDLEKRAYGEFITSGSNSEDDVARSDEKVGAKEIAV